MPRPTPITTALETRAPDGSVIARIQRISADSARHSPKDVGPWVLILFPDHGDGSRSSLLRGGPWNRDGRYATQATTDDDARRVLDYATHVVLAYLERQEEAQDLLESGLDKAVTLAAQETLPMEEN